MRPCRRPSRPDAASALASGSANPSGNRCELRTKLHPKAVAGTAPRCERSQAQADRSSYCRSIARSARRRARRQVRSRRPPTRCRFDRPSAYCGQEPPILCPHRPRRSAAPSALARPPACPPAQAPWAATIQHRCEVAEPQPVPRGPVSALQNAAAAEQIGWALAGRRPTLLDPFSAPPAVKGAQAAERNGRSPMTPPALP